MIFSPLFFESDGKQFTGLAVVKPSLKSTLFGEIIQFENSSISERKINLDNIELMAQNFMNLTVNQKHTNDGNPADIEDDSLFEIDESALNLANMISREVGKTNENSGLGNLYSLLNKLIDKHKLLVNDEVNNENKEAGDCDKETIINEIIGRVKEDLKLSGKSEMIFKSDKASSVIVLQINSDSKIENAEISSGVNGTLPKDSKINYEINFKPYSYLADAVKFNQQISKEDLIDPKIQTAAFNNLDSTKSTSLGLQNDEGEGIPSENRIRTNEVGSQKSQSKINPVTSQPSKIEVKETPHSKFYVVSDSEKSPMSEVESESGEKLSKSLKTEISATSNKNNLGDLIEIGKGNKEFPGAKLSGSEVNNGISTDNSAPIVDNSKANSKNIKSLKLETQNEGTQNQNSTDQIKSFEREVNNSNDGKITSANLAKNSIPAANLDGKQTSSKLKQTINTIKPELTKPETDTTTNYSKTTEAKENEAANSKISSSINSRKAVNLESDSDTRINKTEFAKTENSTSEVKNKPLDLFELGKNIKSSTGIKITESESNKESKIIWSSRTFENSKINKEDLNTIKVETGAAGKQNQNSTDKLKSPNLELVNEDTGKNTITKSDTGSSSQESADGEKINVNSKFTKDIIGGLKYSKEFGTKQQIPVDGDNSKFEASKKSANLHTNISSQDDIVKNYNKEDLKTTKVETGAAGKQNQNSTDKLKSPNLELVNEDTGKNTITKSDAGSSSQESADSEKINVSSKFTKDITDGLKYTKEFGTKQQIPVDGDNSKFEALKKSANLQTNISPQDEMVKNYNAEKKNSNGIKNLNAPNNLFQKGKLPEMIYQATKNFEHSGKKFVEMINPDTNSEMVSSSKYSLNSKTGIDKIVSNEKYLESEVSLEKNDNALKEDVLPKSKEILTESVQKNNSVKTLNEKSRVDEPIKPKSEYTTSEIDSTKGKPASKENQSIKIADRTVDQQKRTQSEQKPKIIITIEESGESKLSEELSKTDFNSLFPKRSQVLSNLGNSFYDKMKTVAANNTGTVFESNKQDGLFDNIENKMNEFSSLSIKELQSLKTDLKKDLAELPKDKSMDIKPENKGENSSQTFDSNLQSNQKNNTNSPKGPNPKGEVKIETEKFSFKDIESNDRDLKSHHNSQSAVGEKSTKEEPASSEKINSKSKTSPENDVKTVSGVHNEPIKNTVHGSPAITKPETKLFKLPQLNKIVKEINDLVINKNDNVININLEPATLGKIKIAIEFIENSVRASFEVENHQVKEAIQNNAEFLKESLNNQGIQLSSLNISTQNSDNNNRNMKTLKMKKKAKIEIKNTKDIDLEGSAAKVLGYNTYEYVV